MGQVIHVVFGGPSGERIIDDTEEESPKDTELDNEKIVNAFIRALMVLTNSSVRDCRKSNDSFAISARELEGGSLPDLIERLDCLPDNFLQTKPVYCFVLASKVLAELQAQYGNINLDGGCLGAVQKSDIELFAGIFSSGLVKATRDL